jgi:hypothetical protein
MNRRILFAFAAVAVAAVAIAPRVNASCPSPQSFQSAFTDVGNDDFVVFAANMVVTYPTVVGQIWDANNYNNINTGPLGALCPASGWLYAGPETPGDHSPAIIGFLGQTGCDNNGLCMPTGSSLMVTVETTTTDGKGAAFVAGRVKNSGEVADGTSIDYDYSRVAGPLTMIPVPRPRSTRTAANTFSVHYDNANAAVHLNDGFTGPQVLVGFKLMEATGPVDPGRNPAAWTSVKRTDPNTGTAIDITGVTVDCTLPATHWLGVLPQFQGGSAGPHDGSYVGEAVAVSCSPTVATPPTYNPKKHAAPGIQK